MPTPDSRRSLRQAAYPQLTEAPTTPTPRPGTRPAGVADIPAVPNAAASSSPSRAQCQTDLPPLAGSDHQHGRPSRTRRYRATVYILPPSISKKIEAYRWQCFTPPAAGKSRRFRGLICHRRSHADRRRHRRWNWRSRHQAAIGRRSSISRGYCPTTDPAISPADLAEWLDDRSMEHVRGAPYHPQTQGKIERWHQTLKNRVLLENYYLPGDLETQLGAFVEHYNHRRYHESLNTSRPPMSTSGAAKPSCWKGKGSNQRPSSTGACNIATPLPEIINQGTLSAEMSVSGPGRISLLVAIVSRHSPGRPRRARYRAPSSRP